MLRILALVLALSGGCVAPPSRLGTRLESTEPLQRIRAIQEVAHDDRVDYLAALVDRLDDPDQAVRLYAILALERMTGTRMGYRYSAPVAERRASVASWRAYVLARAVDGDGAVNDVGAVNDDGLLGGDDEANGAGSAGDHLVGHSDGMLGSGAPPRSISQTDEAPR